MDLTSRRKRTSIVISQKEATPALWQSLIAKEVAKFNVHDEFSDEVIALRRSKQVGMNLPSVLPKRQGNGRLYSTIMDPIQRKTLE